MKVKFKPQPLDLSKRITKNNIDRFVKFILKVSDSIGFKVSSRGWAYILEQKGFITKAEFDKVEALINRCRKEGLLPVDFVAEETARAFHEVHIPTKMNIKDYVKYWARTGYDSARYFEPNWWKGEKYYIQMIVEKVDLVTLFKPICATYHIPIANAKGWSSIYQRAEYARRFKEAENRGLECVLLYCGDHDPDGLRISDTLRQNLEQITDIYWEDGEEGYNPVDLTIERFGLNYDFIINNELTWIDNLITNSKRNLASPAHANFNMNYVQDYLKTVGVRKCEANSLVIRPTEGRQLCIEAIEKYLGKNANLRFEEKADYETGKVQAIIDRIGLEAAIETCLEEI